MPFFLFEQSSVLLLRKDSCFFISAELASFSKPWLLSLITLEKLENIRIVKTVKMVKNVKKIDLKLLNKVKKLKLNKIVKGVKNVLSMKREKQSFFEENNSSKLIFSSFSWKALLKESRDEDDDVDDNENDGDDVDEVGDEDNDEDIVDENEEDEEVFDDWEAGIWMTWYVGLINAGWVLMTVWCGEINELVIFETCGGGKLIG